jgi:DtxR family Mn-dependent transcriptional regulator
MKSDAESAYLFLFYHKKQISTHLISVLEPFSAACTAVVQKHVGDCEFHTKNLPFTFLLPSSSLSPCLLPGGSYAQTHRFFMFQLVCFNKLLGIACIPRENVVFYNKPNRRAFSAPGRESRRQEADTMQIHQSAEDYLETILMLNQRMGRVRSIDVVNELGYTKASVSIAMKKLRENGYIAVDGEGNLTLLEPGREIAERIYSRHRLLTHFFVQLGVDEEVAAEDACKAEHILSEQTLEKIREYALLHDAQDSVK